MRGSPVILGTRVELLRGLACLSCGAKFPPHEVEKHLRHSVACSSRHEEQERAMSARANMGVFGGGMVIPDLEQWVSRNRVELIEKRKKL